MSPGLCKLLARGLGLIRSLCSDLWHLGLCVVALHVLLRIESHTFLKLRVSSGLKVISM